MSNTKLLLIGPKLPNRAFNGSNQALPWLGSALYNEGFTNTVLFDLENPKNTLDELLRESETADAIMWAGTFSVQIEQIDVLSERIKAHLKSHGREDTPIIFGGYGAAQPDRFAKYTPWIDAYFYGPGIEQIGKIARAVAENRFYQALKWDGIPGLSFYDRQLNQFVRGPPVPMPSEESLGSIDQFFRREELYLPQSHDMDIFIDENGKVLSTGQYLSQLGCPNKCKFCGESGGLDDLMFEIVRRVPLETTKKQMKKAHEIGHRAIYWDIETAFQFPNKFEQDLEAAYQAGIAQNGGNTTILSMYHLQKSIWRRYAELKLTYLFGGVENRNPQVLFAIDKFVHKNPLRRAQIAQEYAGYTDEVFEYMQSVGIPDSLFLIMGLPKVSDKSWQQFLNGEISEQDMIYVPATLEDDIRCIQESFRGTKSTYFNANILRFNPDTGMAHEPRYACIRPSGEEPLDAAWFSPRVANILNLPTQEFHQSFRFFEGVEETQPFTTAIDPERAYRTITTIVNCANRFGSRMFFDQAIQREGLITRDPQTGRYTLKAGSYRDFEALEIPKIQALPQEKNQPIRINSPLTSEKTENTSA